MVVHSPLVLGLPRAARDRCSPMVCILFFILENSIGQEEEVWGVGVGDFPYPRDVLAGCAARGLGGLLGTCALTGPQRASCPGHTGPASQCWASWPGGQRWREGGKAGPAVGR